MEFGKVTALFGPNNSGKTSLIKLLLMLKQTVESRGRTLLNLGGDPKDLVDLGDYAQIAYMHNEKNEIGVSIGWKSTQNQENNFYLYRVDSAWKKHDDLIIQTTLDLSACQANNEWLKIQESYSPETNFEKLTLSDKPGEEYSSRKSNLGGWQPERSFYELSHELSLYTEEINFYKLKKELETGFRNIFERIHYLGPTRAQPQRLYAWAGEGGDSIGVWGEHTVKALLTEDRRWASYRTEPHQKINQWLRKLGVAYKIDIKRVNEVMSFYETRIYLDNDNNHSNLVDVGFGVSQVLPIVALAYLAPPESIIILEQPELHLHPKVQAELADLFLEAAQTRNIQFIIESHSEHLLARLQRRLAERSGVNEHLTENDVKLYFCQREGSESTLQPLQLDQYGRIQNWPPDFFGDLLDERLKAMEAMALRQHKAQTNGQAAK